MSSPHVLLLSGVPGVGKTTVIRKVAEHLSSDRLAGFYTEEIREGGERRGFRLKTFDGSERAIAHVDFPKLNRVGKYGVDVAAIDGIAAAALAVNPDVTIYLVDEIGKMECLSQRFVEALCTLLGSNKTVVATIAVRGTGPIAEVKQRQDTLLWEVTRANRDTMPECVLEWLQKQASSPSL